jgi:hypothetical protein
MRLQIPGVKTRQFLSVRGLPDYMFHYLTFVTGCLPLFDEHLEGATP